MRIFTTAFVLGVFASFSIAAAEPAPQYSAEQLEKDFAKPAPTAPGACESQGMVTGPDGTCQPKLGKRRGFSLATPDAAPAAAPTASPGPALAPGRPTAGKAARHARPAMMAAAPAPVAGRDLLITFANGSAALTDQAKVNAKVFATALNSPALQGVRFAIDGHTDAVGGRDYNLKLSRDRAQALVDFLAAQGVDRARFDVTGYGFDKPADPAHPKAAANRRVEARRLT